jgi:rhamnose transport system permease protein
MSAEPVIDAPAPGGPGLAAGLRAFDWRALRRWEMALVVVLGATIIFGAAESSEFLTTTTVFYTGLNMAQVAIMALPLTLIVVTGEIDLSVAAMLGLSCSVFGYAFGHGIDVYAAAAIALAVGAVGGALNGFLVTRLGLPSIAVTIGTLTMFRGIAEVILGQSEVTAFPTSLTTIGVSPIPGTKIAWAFGFFLVLAVIYGVVLHTTPLGRSLFAMGLNKETAFFSGIRVNRIKFLLFVASGVVCAFVGIIYALQNDASRYDAGTGLELNVVAVVLFGGISIFGGRGTIIGVVLSVIIVGCLTEALTLINVSAEEQNIVFGVLLLLSVLVPNTADGYGRLRRRLRRTTTVTAAVRE